LFAIWVERAACSSAPTSGGAFWLEQGSHEKRVPLQFNRADIAIGIQRACPQWARQQAGPERRVQPIAAMVALGDGRFAIGLLDAGAGEQVQHTLGFDQCAAEWGDDGPDGIWRGFGMVGVGPAQGVPCIFDQSVLKPATGTQKRHAVFAGKADGQQGAIPVFVRAGRHAPQRVEARQLVSVVYGVGAQPVYVERDAERLGGHRQGKGNRAVGGDGRVVIADQANA
jgi:hypothetical protein